MRIGGGNLSGRRIKAPAGGNIRPSGGRLKKSLFDILAPRLPRARFLDLFAGAGGVGLEALSRGADHVTFVEQGRRAADAIQKNLDELGLAAQARLLRREARSALASLERVGGPFDLIFIDPPYRLAVHHSLLQKIGASTLLRSGGVLIVEHHHKTSLAGVYGNLRRIRQTRAGESCLSFYRSEGPQPG